MIIYNQKHIRDITDFLFNWQHILYLITALDKQPLKKKHAVANRSLELHAQMNYSSIPCEKITKELHVTHRMLICTFGLAKKFVLNYLYLLQGNVIFLSSAHGYVLADQRFLSVILVTNMMQPCFAYFFIHLKYIFINLNVE